MMKDKTSKNQEPEAVENKNEQNGSISTQDFTADKKNKKQKNDKKGKEPKQHKQASQTAENNNSKVKNSKHEEKLNKDERNNSEDKTDISEPKRVVFLQKLFTKKQENENSAFEKRQRKEHARRISKRAMLKKILEKMDVNKYHSEKEYVAIRDELEKAKEAINVYNNNYKVLIATVAVLRETSDRIEQTLKESLNDSKTKAHIDYESESATEDKRYKLSFKTLCSIFAVYKAMDKCENYDQISFEVFKLKKLFEEYEELTGEKLEWRL